MKFNIKEDTISDYFDKLQSHMESEKESFVGGLARKPVGEMGSMEGAITELAPKWNPFLFMTGQSRNNWKIKVSNEISNVEIMYSAMATPNLNTAKGDNTRKVWWEFADKNNPNLLGRDYAEFQETGEDDIARSEDAKHKHFIRDGLYASNSEIQSATARYLNAILKLEKIPVRSGDFVER